MSTSSIASELTARLDELHSQYDHEVNALIRRQWRVACYVIVFMLVSGEVFRHIHVSSQMAAKDTGGPHVHGTQ